MNHLSWEAIGLKSRDNALCVRAIMGFNNGIDFCHFDRNMVEKTLMAYLKNIASFLSDNL